MSPGDDRKDSFKFKKVIVFVFFFVRMDMFDYIIRINVERHNEHRNMHGCVPL